MCIRDSRFFVHVPTNGRTIVKAVIAYQKYLRDINDKLFSTFMSRTGNEHQLSERLTNKVWSMFDLPRILT